jgi:ribosome-associated protein
MMQTTPVLEPAELAQRVVDELSERQVEDIALLDIRKVSSFTDYFVIGTATNERQMKAAVDALDRTLGASGIHMRKREGTPDSGWMLLDFGDVIVHLFSPEARTYYRLDELWSRSAPIVRFA